MRTVMTLARWEAQSAARTKWVAGCGVAFALSIVGVVLVGLRSVSELGLTGIGPAATNLLGVTMLLPPLVGLLLGAGGIAGARERATLHMVLAQPGVRRHYVLGTFLGLAVAMWLILAAGLGAAGLILGAVADLSDLKPLVAVSVATFAASTVAVALGMALSSFCRSRSQAIAWCVVLWFFFAVGADLLLLSVVPALDIGAAGVLTSILLNPVESARTLALLIIDPELGALGPFGAFLSFDLGAGAATLLLTGALVVWCAVAIGAAHLRVARLEP